MNKLLIVEKVNHRFKRMTKTDQASGLSNCIEHIVSLVPHVVRARVDSIDHVITAMQSYKAPAVMFEGMWVDEAGFRRIKALFPNTELFVHIHSHVAFLTAEAMAFHNLKMYQTMGVKVVFNNYKTMAALNLKNSLFLPNIYTCHFYDRILGTDSGTINIGCHGSLRPLKNQVLQAACAIQYAEISGKKLNFHMNLDRSENSGVDVHASLKGLFSLYPNHTLVNDPWLRQYDFIQACRKLDLGMQISMSETFNLVSADYVAAGIPILVSSEIDWACPESTTETTCADSIIADIRYAIHNAEDLIHENKVQLSMVTNSAKQKWEAFIEALGE